MVAAGKIKMGTEMEITIIRIWESARNKDKERFTKEIAKFGVLVAGETIKKINEKHGELESDSEKSGH